MMSSAYYNKLIPVLSILLAAQFYFGCEGKKYVGRQVKLPYPDQELAEYYQARIDSSEYEWFTDTKDAASSFANEYRMLKEGVSANDIIIIGEGLFHATVEIELPDKILVLEMERPFKNLGRRSIWQVVEMKEKPWPEKR